MTDRERYGTIAAFQRLFAEEGIEVDYHSIAARIEEGRRNGIILIKTARLCTGHIMCDSFYAESEVRAACHDLFNQFDAAYFSDPSRILHDFTAFAQQLGPDKTPLDLSTHNLSSLSVTCHNGETAKGITYLDNAAVALGLGQNIREVSSKRAENLRHLFKVAGFEIAEYPERDTAYYQTRKYVLHDLTAFAQQLGPDKTPLDLGTRNFRTISVVCHNGETVTGSTYLRNAAVALGLAKDSAEAHSKQAETLRKLKEIAGLKVKS